MNRIIKNIFSFICAAGIMLNTGFSGTSDAAHSSGTVCSLVLFAQFPGRNGNFMSEYTDDMLSLFEKENTCRSLSGYINEISYGQTKTEFVYPQLKNGTVTPYIMNDTEEGYLNTDLMVTEVVSSVSVPKDAVLDGNGDGTVDNIIVVFDADEKKAGTTFWPKAFSLPGISINGYRTGNVNLLNSYSLFENTITGSNGVLCHEFLHSLGYPDLYRADGVSGIPVGQWDIMAADSIYVQYPLAYLRYSISGWLDAETITESGEYELKPVSSDSGKRLYILKTPLSDTEFFALEYRQKGKRYSDEMDTKIYGSGLVVYRINTAFDGNRKQRGDEIYVFRPDETDTYDAAGDIFSSFYGGEGAPDSIGLLSEDADISDGAIVYSDGTNSGIRISDIKISNDSLKFRAEFSELSETDVWKQITSAEWMKFRSSLDLKLAGDTPYLLTDSDDGVIVSSLSDGAWKKASSPVRGAESAKLCMRGETPYILYNDSSYTYVLAEYSDGKWKELLKGNELSQYQDFDIYDDKIWIGYTTGTWPYSLHVSEYSIPEGKVISEYDGYTDVCNISVTASADGAAVSYRHAVKDTYAGADIISGGNLITRQLSYTSCGSTESALIDGQYFISGSDEAPLLYTIRKNGFSALNIEGFSDLNWFSSYPFQAGSETGLLINSQNSDDLSVYLLKNRNYNVTYRKCGNSISGEIVNCPSAVSDGKTVYVAFSGSDGKVTVKSIKISEPKKIIGDFNYDGTVDANDYINMIAYFAGYVDISADADIDENGTVNIADFCLLKEIILKNQSDSN